MANWCTLDELKALPDKNSLEWAWYRLSRAKWKWESWPITIIKRETPRAVVTITDTKNQTKKPEDILREAIHTHVWWSPLQFLFHDFILHIVPENTWNDMEKVTAQLRLYVEYNTVSRFLRSLPEGKNFTWLAYSNHFASEWRNGTLDDRAKYVSEWVQLLVRNLQNSI